MAGYPRIQSVPWTVQPQVVTRANLSHFSAPWLERAINFSTRHDAVSGSFLPFSVTAGALTLEPGMLGIGAKSSHIGASFQTTIPKAQAANALTIVAQVDPTAFGATRGLIGVDFAFATAAGEFKAQWYTDNKWYIDVANEVERVASTQTTANPFVVAITWDGATKRLYINGLEVANGADSGVLSGNPTYRIGAGMKVYGVNLYSTAFAAGHVALLSNQFWSVHAGAPRRVWTPVASGGGGSFNPAWAYGSTKILGGAYA